MLIPPQVVTQLQRTIRATLIETCVVIRQTAGATSYDPPTEVGRATPACSVNIEETALTLPDGTVVVYRGVAKLSGDALEFAHDDEVVLTDIPHVGDMLEFGSETFRIARVTESKVNDVVIKRKAYLE